MCLSLPYKVVSIKGTDVLASNQGISNKLIAPAPIPVKKGDWVISMQGIIVRIITEEEANKIMASLRG